MVRRTVLNGCCRSGEGELDARNWIHADRIDGDVHGV